MKSLLGGQGDALISQGAALRLNGRRWIPDLTVRCKRTGTLLLAIEVWHTHSVSHAKRTVYLAAGIPWVEVKAWNVLERVGKKTLSILDWGGIEAVTSPVQRDLFDQELPWPTTAKEHQRMAFDLRCNDWPMPPASQLAVGAQSVGACAGQAREFYGARNP